MRMRNFAIIGALGLATLSGGCAFGIALGFTPQENENGYAAAATATDAGITLGKLDMEAVAIACKADNYNFSGLVSNRNIADGVKSYSPANTAHQTLQNDGAKLSASCSLPAMTGTITSTSPWEGNSGGS